jgi:hypothetical protein
VIVDRDSLVQAVEHFADLVEARRRHPDDEGLRQRVRAAGDTVRRIARALERGGVLVLVALVLTGCGEIVFVSETRFEWRWDEEPACLTPEPDHAEGVARASQLWDQFGVELVEAETAEVRVCITSGSPAKGYSGMVRRDDGGIWMGVRDIWDSEYFSVVATHEFGHVILEGAEEHLPESRAGIMSSPSIKSGVDWAWSDDDVTHVESFGYAFEAKAGL